MTKFQDQEFPEGYDVVDTNRGCHMCAFEDTICDDYDCTPGTRTDGRDVIFVKKADIGHASKEQSTEYLLIVDRTIAGTFNSKEDLVKYLDENIESLDVQIIENPKYLPVEVEQSLKFNVV